MTTAFQERLGSRPSTVGPMPHMQTNQLSSPEIAEKLAETLFSIEGIIENPSRISIPGARGLFVKNLNQLKNPLVKNAQGELGHIHPDPELGSLHLQVDEKLAYALIEKGWGEFHPLVAQGALPPNLIMVYAPRNEEEVETIAKIVKSSYDFVRGLNQ